MLKMKVEEGGRYQEMEERREGASVLELSMIRTCNNCVSADILDGKRLTMIATDMYQVTFLKENKTMITHSPLSTPP